MPTNDLLLRALRRQPHERAPIWVMRQAGRYLPEYRKVRADAGDFMTLCQTPELATTVTLQPVDRFPLDAAIIFSDILTIPDAFGLELSFVSGQGPVFGKPIKTIKDIEALPTTSISDKLQYVYDAIAMTHHELAGRIPLIGFAGSPWTLATYMLEGSSSRDFGVIKRWLFNEPTALHLLLDKLANQIVFYLKEQVRAGAEALMLFDTWGGVLTPHHYHDFSRHYLEKIVTAIKAETDTPILVFTKQGGQWLEDIASIGADGVGLDWTTDIGEAKRRIGDKVALQGNLDPAVLYADEPVIRAEVDRIFQAFGDGPGHIFNLGHGIKPDVSPEKMAYLVNYVVSRGGQTP